VVPDAATTDGDAMTRDDRESAQLRRSAMVEICAQVYQLHRDDGAGRCAHCTLPLTWCVPRRNAAKVLAAAGLDPNKFDPDGGRQDP
jgi:hypothetical protein